jgi:hypothetical protein
MCDFSLQAKASRPAVVGETLVVTDFGTGTNGFSSHGKTDVAVCVLPGTELAFDGDITIKGGFLFGPTGMGHKVARFRQVDKDKLAVHHDALELPSGEIVKLTQLAAGQIARVLQLPAAPTTPEEAEEQRRVAFVG